MARSVADKGSETILLVEDEPMVRRLTGQLLEEQGYRVLEAQNAGEALVLAKKYEGTIDLLFTEK